jgi:hypothetical protein
VRFIFSTGFHGTRQQKFLLIFAQAVVARKTHTFIYEGVDT